MPFSLQARPLSFSSTQRIQPPAGSIMRSPATKQAGPSPLTQSYNLYNTAVKQQAGDYDEIMNRLKSHYDTQVNNPNKPNLTAPGQYTPQLYDYNQTADSRNSLSTLKGLSESGGYTGSELSALRERGISPIRAVYANANRNIDRQRVLQGGFSPNYTAAKAKMAREMSSMMADKMNDVNAGIAERVAQNRMSAAPQYAQFAQGESSLRNQYGAANAQSVNEANRFNIGNQLDFQKLQSDITNRDQSNNLGALQAMTSLYGTTPALSQLFGSQALQGAGLQNDINQSNSRNNLQLISSMLGQM